MSISQQSDSPTKASALRYARFGLRVLGLHSVDDGGCTCRKITCASPGKHPRYDLSPHGSREPYTSPKTIGQWPEPFNIGVALGRVETSRGVRHVYVFDVDNREVAALLRAQAIERLTAVAATGRGLHVWLGSESEVPNFIVKATTVERIGEFRGDRQYVVMPPSIHVSGWQYEWLGAPVPEARAMPKVLLVDDPVNYVEQLLAGAGVEMQAPRQPYAGTEQDYNGEELVDAASLPLDLASRLSLERVLLRGELIMTGEYDRSGKLWSHAHHIYAAAETIGRPIDAEEVAGLLKGIDRASYRKYTDDRLPESADREYRQIARKVLAIRRGD